MKNRSFYLVAVFFTIVFTYTACDEQHGSNQSAEDKDKMMAEFKKISVFPSQEKYGEHLVAIAGCNDCHSPKKMGPHGPIVDSFKMMSGHPAHLPAPDVNRKEMQSKGLVVTNDLTAWVGPWGISYTANLTPDPTGIESWTIAQFTTAIRKGKFHGQENGRDLLPPMPWETYLYMTDDELAAIFAYLKTLKPINNLVPDPLPPVK